MTDKEIEDENFQEDNPHSNDNLIEVIKADDIRKLLKERAKHHSQGFPENIIFDELEYIFNQLSGE